MHGQEHFKIGFVTGVPSKEARIYCHKTFNIVQTSSSQIISGKIVWGGFIFIFFLFSINLLTPHEA